jgi:NTE family protein
MLQSTVGFKWIRVHLPVLCLVLVAGVLPAQSGGGVAPNYDYHFARRTERPVVGLVLSGGAAKGAAHVGVIKVLEELRVPVDLVVGTSMGSIVGGLYAAGYSPEAMEAELTSIDWSQMLSDRPATRNQTERSKRGSDQFARAEVGLGADGVAFPSGFIAGHRLQFALRSMTLHTRNVTDFDHLPIPFRAIATDLRTGEAVIIDDGQLDDALRASMAVPGVFTPVVRDGRTLVDGGVVNNFPVDVARDMGAEIIIAVNVSPPGNIDQPASSLFGVSMQVIDILTQQNIREDVELLTAEDVTITIEPDGYDSASFGDSARIIENGYRTAAAVSDALAQFALSDAEFALYLLGQRRVPYPTIRIDEIKVDIRGATNPRIVSSRMRIREGDILDLQKLEADLERVYATGYFRTVDYEVETRDGFSTLTVIAEDKPWGPTYLRFGMQYNDDFTGGAAATFSSEFVATQLNALGAELTVGASIGRRMGADIEYYQPLNTRDQLYLLADAGAEQEIRDVYANETRQAELRIGSVKGFLRLGLRPTTAINVTAGFGFDGTWQDTAIGPEQPDEDVLYLVGFRGEAGFDTTDNRNFPHRGTGLRVSGAVNRPEFGSDAEFSVVEIDARQAGTVGRHTVVLSGAAGTSWLADSVQIPAFSLGGFGSFSGYRPGQLSGRHYGTAALYYQFRAAGISSDWGTAIYLGASVETAGAWQDRDAIDGDDLVYGGSVYLGVDTAIGPAYLAYGRTLENGLGTVSLLLGKTY